MATSIGVPNDTSGTAVPVSVEPITSLNGAAVTETHPQRFIPTIRKSAGIAVDAPGDEVFGIDVDVMRLPVATAVALTLVAVNATTGVQLIAANTNRKGLMVFNHSSAGLRLKYDTTATIPAVAPFSAPVPAGGYWEMPLPIYKGAITGLWDTPDTNGTGANISEST